MKALYILVILVFLVGCTADLVDVSVTDSDEGTTPENASDQELIVPESEDINETQNDSLEDLIPEEETTAEEQELLDDIAEREQEEEELRTARIAKISIEDIRFKPSDITIEKDYTVVWEHEDTYQGNEKIIHQITIYPPLNSKVNTIRSPRLFLGDSFNYTFTESGEYWYIDLIFKQHMRGYITVE